MKQRTKQTLTAWGLAFGLAFLCSVDPMPEPAQEMKLPQTYYADARTVGETIRVTVADFAAAVLCYYKHRREGLADKPYECA